MLTTVGSTNRVRSEEKLLLGALAPNSMPTLAESPLYFLAFCNPVHRWVILRLHLYRCTIQ